MLTWFDPHLPLLALSRSPGSREPSLDHDLQVIQNAGIRRIVCLQEDFELEMIGDSISQRRHIVECLGLAFTHEPIEDFTAPSLRQALQLVELVEREFSLNQRVLIHCQAGLGRAGTIAACLLVKVGMTSEDAIATARYYRLGAIQSEEQESFVSLFEWMAH